MGASLELREAALLRSQGFVGGRWVDAIDGRTFEVQDPATGEMLVRVANMGAAETTSAIDAAQAALGDWKRRPAKDRATVLKAWFHLMLAHADDLAMLMTREQGKRCTHIQDAGHVFGALQIARHPVQIRGDP